MVRPALEERRASTSPNPLEVTQLEAELAQLDARIDELLAELPNLPDPSVPEGATDDDGEVLREGGARRPKDREEGREALAFPPADLDPVELALRHYLTGKLREHGFTLGTRPSESLAASGPEAGLATLHAGQVLPESSLPARYVGGLQEHVVAMLAFAHPGRSAGEHERFAALQADILEELEVPFRVVNLAARALRPEAAQEYACQAWSPAGDGYRTIAWSVNATGYQSRRLRCLFQPDRGGAPEAVHTVSGEFDVPGTLAAILENSERRDGAVAIPAILSRLGAPGKLSLRPRPDP